MTAAKLLNALFWLLMGAAVAVALLMMFTEIGSATTDASVAIGLAAIAAVVNTFIPADPSAGSMRAES